MVDNKQKDNVTVLANISELVTCVIKNVSGKDIADSLNDETLTKATLNDLILRRAVKNFTMRSIDVK